MNIKIDVISVYFR